MFSFLLCVFSSAAATRKESRYSRGLALFFYALGTAAAAAILAIRFFARDAWFVSDFHEGVLLSIVLSGLICLLLELRASSRLDPAFPACLALLLGAAAFFKASDPVPDLPRELSPHTFFMFLALAAFSLSFLFAALFLVQDHLIKRKLVGRAPFELPPLEFTGRLNFAFLTVGTASLFAGVGSGVAYFEKAAGGPGLLQPTAVLSLIMLALYAAILMLRIGPLERSRRAAIVSVISYGLLLATFLAAHSAFGGAG